MKLVPSLLALALTTGALTACGSSHHYTAKQVQQVFAAQGITLRKAASQEIPGVVSLREDHRIAVLVVAATPKAGMQYFHLRNPGYRTRRDGNIAVTFRPSDASAVTAALSRLH